jgi:hypothetical protein
MAAVGYFLSGRIFSTKRSLAMKSLIALAAAALIACSGPAARAATSAADHVDEMKECAVCKSLAADESLIKRMTWEIYKIKDGMLTVTTVPKEMKQRFDAAMAGMMKTVEGLTARFQSGEQVKLCSFCTAMGDLMQSGAHQENVETAGGSIGLVTSTAPEVVKKIHAHADKFNEAEAAGASAR